MAEPTTFPEPVLKNFLCGSEFCKKKKKEYVFNVFVSTHSNTYFLMTHYENITYHLYIGPSWSFSYVSWISNYLFNQCLSPLTLWVQIPHRRGIHEATFYDKVCLSFVTVRWFSPGTPVSSTNKSDLHNKTEILLKVVLNTINHIYTQSKGDNHEKLFTNVRIKLCNLHPNVFFKPSHKFVNLQHYYSI